MSIRSRIDPFALLACQTAHNRYTTYLTAIQSELRPKKLLKLTFDIPFTIQIGNGCTVI